MSWHFSQALAEVFLPGNFSDGMQCALWSSMPFARDDSCSDKMKDTCHRSPFGTMYVPSMDEHGGALLMSFRAASPAKTSARTAKEMGSMESARASGWRWPGSFAKYDRLTSSWRTPQCLLAGGLDEFSETWPSWGSMRDGAAFQREKPGHLTKENASGFALGLTKKRSHSVPTPTASDHILRKCTNGLLNFDTMKAVNLNRFLGGRPNPPWNEWLMDWPMGWTDSKPLETDRFLQWRQQHGVC